MNFKRKSFIVVISAPSGAGKSSVCEKLVKESKIDFSVSYTTRSPRLYENNGKEYFFVSKEVFQKKIDNNEFLEFAEVHGNYYGTCKKQVDKILESGINVLLDIDVQGMLKLKKMSIDFISIFVSPPSLKVLKERLINRSANTAQEINCRLKNAKEELKQIENFDYIVVNEDLDKATNQILNIIKSEELKTCRNFKRVKNITED